MSPTQGGGWTEQVLYSFNYPGMSGANPYAGVIFDSAGNLYGTTESGGEDTYGTVFELLPTRGGDWTEEVLRTFNYPGPSGAQPYAGLIFDATGNLYGTTYSGRHLWLRDRVRVDAERPVAGREQVSRATAKL